MAFCIVQYKQIQFGEGNYYITSIGRVLNNKTNKYLKNTIDDKGYIKYKLFCKGKKSKNIRLHQLLGQYFINNPKPDYRPTLLWNPEVTVENGKAKIEFYTSDNLARYHVIVEGISKNGKICLATSLLTVSIPRE